MMVLAFLLSNISFGQQNSITKTPQKISNKSTKTNFTVKPFTPFFVNNKGQFDKYDGNLNSANFISPAFGSQMGNTITLFNTNSIQFIQNRMKKEEEENESKDKSPEQKEVEALRQTMTFLNSNPDAEFNYDGIEKQYFTYPDPKINNGTIKANGYKTIGIKNLYPGIDITYSFKNEGGIEYSFIVHPGANASAIKIQWSGVDDISIDNSGNLKMNSENGIYTDKAPIAYYQNDENSKVASAFNVKDNIVSFLLVDPDNTKTLVIDPWVVNPSFTTFNSAFDIEHDPSGNIYVYGGAPGFQLQKYTSIGSPLWTYNTTPTYYGDFTLDSLGNAYVIYGPYGTTVLKINSAGTLVWTADSTFGTIETYRIFPNHFNGKLEIMGMNIVSNVTPLVFDVDPNTGYYSSVNLLTTIDGEIREMSVDANGDAFGIAHCGGSSSDISGNNVIWKVDPLNATITSVEDGYMLTESEASNTSTNFSGFNGMAVSSCALFTYDGMTVKKWDKTTLVQLASVAITGGIAYVTGGLCTDSCGNVYVGGPDSIFEFDNNLNYLTAVSTNGEQVYDVNNGNAPGEILACGQTFFGSFSFPVCTNSSSSSSENINIVSCTSPLILTPTSTGSTYLWNTGATTDSITVDTAGMYWVHVLDATVCNQIVSLADTFNVTFATHPTVNLGPNLSICGNGPDTIRAGNPGDTYHWSTGATTDSIYVTTSNTYYVSVSNGGCTTVDSVTITFVTNPTVNLGPDTTICSNASITLNAGNTGFSFLWNTGASSQTITVDTAGNYFVYVSEGVCHGADTIHISIAIPPVVNIGPDSTICSNQSVTLNAGNPGSNFSWSTGATSQSITASTSGTYWVHVSNAACSANDTAVITVIQMPVVNLGPDSTLCVGESLTIDAGNAGYIYHWSTGATTQTISVTMTGNYWVIVNQGLCAANDTAIINFIPPPVVNLGNDTMVCSPHPVTLDAGNNGNTYFWSSGQQSQSITVNTPGIYWVLVNNGSCTRTDSITISVVTPPVLTPNFVADTTRGCNPLTINFTNNSSGGTAYIWNYGDSSSLGSSTNETHTYTDSGLFTVTLIMINDTSTVCGTYKDTLIQTRYIAVADPVHVTGNFIASPLSGCTPLVVNITNTSINGTDFLWNLGNNSIFNSDTSHIQTAYIDAGTYTITLIASSPNARCYNPPDTMNIQITVDTCNLYVPNTFSPNGDGKNEFFHLAAEGYGGYHLIIFNRWGQKVFESNDTQNLWNGKIDNTGGDCPDGTYYYIFNAIDPNHQPYADHGFLTLIR